MDTRYAPDSLIPTLQNSTSNGAEYVYQHSEAKDAYSAAVMEIEWMLEALQRILDIRGSLFFAIAASKQPFQITRAAPDLFVLLVDRQVVYYLLSMCLRLQSLNPLCKFLALPEIKVEKSYEGKFLLDITKDIVFHTSDVSGLLGQTRHLVAYQAALLHIVAHEIAHVAHGHIDFKVSSAFIDFATDDDDLNLTIRALEMDADSSATTSVFDVFERIRGSALSREGALNNLTEEEFTTNLRRQYVTGVIFAQIFQDTLTSNFFPKNHPIGYARFLTSTYVLQTVFSRLFPDNVELPEHSRRSIVAAFIELSGGLRFLGHPIAANTTVWEGDKEPGHDYTALGVASGLEHLHLLHRRWSRLRPHLESHLRGGVLAPAQAEPY